MGSSPSGPVPTPLATAQDVARFLNIDTPRLAKMRFNGTGPAYTKVGRDVRYRWSSVLAWVDSQTRTTTQQAAA
jgi:hypothetical protein